LGGSATPSRRAQPRQALRCLGQTRLEIADAEARQGALHATLEAEDARRPSREREALVGERTRLVNRATAPVSDTALALGETVQSNGIFWAINE